ncbi:restriction endonuclease subunit S [Acinetobacter sp. ANC 4635]|uniref:restriction endonuclease subunit S n=1 Tax=Acinetobacter sp. ANC 4635 TaxID=2529846 RepID=UPI001038BC35|nr:restriction endonuclease subunit S [Acinetobacter sp. ANC 4635]TCB29540.1 restriction endonuclease subunit S [Acinetobacter sp. ANC 4635]
MSFLEKLLGGVEVEWKVLGDIAKYEQPTKYLVKTTNYREDFETPVLTAGKTFILGYTDEIDGIYKASENPVIIFDDFTTANKWVDFDFKAKSSAMKMISSVDESKVPSKYIYYWLNTLPNELVDGDHKRQWIGNYAKKEIPIPCPENPQKSIKIQAEIVRILDAFSAMTAELTVELTARKKQYNYYRDQLLSFNEGGMEWKTLNEVCSSISAGGDLPENYIKGQIEPSDEFPYPIYANATGDNGLYGFTDGYKIESDAVTISARGAKIGYHMVRDGNFTPIIRLITLVPNKSLISTRYLNYALDMTPISGTDGGIPQLTVPTVKKISIPIPYPNDIEKSIAEQARIVAILDKFDALINSITEGLPREIELRQKQYEYYRDLLFSFTKPEDLEA